MKKILAIILVASLTLGGELAWAKGENNPLQFLSKQLRKVDLATLEAIAWEQMENIQATSPEMFAKLIPKTFRKSRLRPPVEGRYKTYKVAMKVTPDYQAQLGKKVLVFVSINTKNTEDIWVGYLYLGLTDPYWVAI